MADPFRPYKPVFTYQELKEMCRTTDLVKARESWLISHFRPPFTEYFVGKSYTFHFDNGRTLHYRFSDVHTLEWSEDGESFFDEYYEALESTVKGVFLVHHIRRRTLPFPGLTLIIDTERELVTWSDQEFGRADDCDKNVMPQLVFGWYGTPKAARHGFTTELCGAILDWKYSDDFIIRHCYLTPDCMTSPGAPTDNEDEYLFRKTLPAAYAKVRDGLYIAAFAEDGGSGVTLLIDLDRLRDVGSFFGMGGDGQLGSYTIGAVAGRGKFGFTGEYSIPYGPEPEDAPV